MTVKSEAPVGNKKDDTSSTPLLSFSPALPNPWKKPQKHGSKSHLMQKQDEIVLEKHVSKLEQLENTTKKLYKDAKKYEDCILEANRSEKKMTSDLSNSMLCQEEEKLRELVQEWHSYVSQDSIKASQKVQKLQEKEKTGANIVKLESAKQNLVNLEEDFKAQDKLLKSELPLLYEGRIEYFQPCLESLIKAH
ncbi:bridging integrator 3-like protein, partial [Caerostris extrusa]